MKRIMFLVTGILLNVVFTIMAYSQNSNIFEMLYFNQGFSDMMYNMSLYPTVAGIITCCAWAGAATYYFGINSVHFDRWYHWLGVLAVVTIAAPVISLLYINGTFKDAGVDYAAQTAQFIMPLFVVSAVLFIIASFSVRWWSTNCRHTPFPQ